MPNHELIYQTEAHQYHRLIAAQPDLSGVIEEICPYRGLDILDLGAGSGRLTCSLLPLARTVTAADLSPAMLEELVSQAPSAYLSRLKTLTADHRHVPLASQSFDLIVSGWSLCYLADNHIPVWESNLERMMDEIVRLLRPGGTVILFETMGTGCEVPEPPDFLHGYYAQLQERYGFHHRRIRTDYAFGSPQEAEELMRFFFGDALGDQTARRGDPLVTEWAGVWWKHLGNRQNSDPRDQPN
ncbi:class I SAM-dependent methyltransferase [Paenibacillus sp. S-38]|uniref:class I SAM-dependent methyltransferase n=1 Tax=Paenibacillus sp. S-38 TaxID=3416710 RepID=UPI003CE673CF